MFARTDGWGLIATAGAALSVLMLAAGVGLSQTADDPSLGIQEQPRAAPAQAPGPTSAPLPSRPENPGLINEMGKLFDRLPSMLPPLKSPTETIDDLNARAKEAVKEAVRNATQGAGDAVSRLPSSTPMVSGRMICPVAPSGTPDCKAGADRLCRSKGYKEGASLNTDAAETCSPKVFIPGRKRKPDDCRTDNYVTTALCQ